MYSRPSMRIEKDFQVDSVPELKIPKEGGNKTSSSFYPEFDSVPGFELPNFTKEGGNKTSSSFYPKIVVSPENTSSLGALEKLKEQSEKLIVDSQMNIHSYLLGKPSEMSPKLKNELEMASVKSGKTASAISEVLSEFESKVPVGDSIQKEAYSLLMSKCEEMSKIHSMTKNCLDIPEDLYTKVKEDKDYFDVEAMCLHLASLFRGDNSTSSPSHKMVEDKLLSLIGTDEFEDLISTSQTDILSDFQTKIKEDLFISSDAMDTDEESNTEEAAFSSSFQKENLKNSSANPSDLSFILTECMSANFDVFVSGMFSLLYPLIGQGTSYTKSFLSKLMESLFISKLSIWDGMGKEEKELVFDDLVVSNAKLIKKSFRILETKDAEMIVSAFEKDPNWYSKLSEELEALKTVATNTDPKGKNTKYIDTFINNHTDADINAFVTLRVLRNTKEITGHSFLHRKMKHILIFIAGIFYVTTTSAIPRLYSYFTETAKTTSLISTLNTSVASDQRSLSSLLYESSKTPTMMKIVDVFVISCERLKKKLEEYEPFDPSRTNADFAFAKFSIEKLQTFLNDPSTKKEEAFKDTLLRFHNCIFEINAEGRKLKLASNEGVGPSIDNQLYPFLDGGVDELFKVSSRIPVLVNLVSSLDKKYEEGLHELENLQESLDELQIVLLTLASECSKSEENSKKDLANLFIEKARAILPGEEGIYDQVIEYQNSATNRTKSLERDILTTDDTNATLQELLQDSLDNIIESSKGKTSGSSQIDGHTSSSSGKKKRRSPIRRSETVELVTDDEQKDDNPTSLSRSKIPRSSPINLDDIEEDRSIPVKKISNANRRRVAIVPRKRNPPRKAKSKRIDYITGELEDAKQYLEDSRKEDERRRKKTEEYAIILKSKISNIKKRQMLQNAKIEEVNVSIKDLSIEIMKMVDNDYFLKKKFSGIIIEGYSDRNEILEASASISTASMITGTRMECILDQYASDVRGSSLVDMMSTRICGLLDWGDSFETVQFMKGILTSIRVNPLLFAMESIKDIFTSISNIPLMVSSSVSSVITNVPDFFANHVNAETFNKFLKYQETFKVSDLIPGGEFSPISSTLNFIREIPGKFKTVGESVANFTSEYSYSVIGIAYESLKTISRLMDISMLCKILLSAGPIFTRIIPVVMEGVFLVGKNVLSKLEVFIEKYFPFLKAIKPPPFVFKILRKLFSALVSSSSAIFNLAYKFVEKVAGIGTTLFDVIVNLYSTIGKMVDQMKEDTKTQRTFKSFAKTLKMGVPIFATVAIVGYFGMYIGSFSTNTGVLVTTEYILFDLVRMYLLNLITAKIALVLENIISTITCSYCPIMMILRRKINDGSFVPSRTYQKRQFDSLVSSCNHSFKASSSELRPLYILFSFFITSNGFSFLLSPLFSSINQSTPETELLHLAPPPPPPPFIDTDQSIPISGFDPNLFTNDPNLGSNDYNEIITDSSWFSFVSDYLRFG